MTQRLTDILTHQLMERLYVKNGKTDKEIAKLFGVDRTHVNNIRRSLNITTRPNTGTLGEKRAKLKLSEENFRVKDMNEISKISSFDLLINEKIKVDIKSAKFNDRYRRFTFSLSEKRENGNVVNENRILLENGRTKKVFSNTCDYLIFVCMKGRHNEFYVIPSSALPEKLGCLNIKPNDEKFMEYKNNWNQLRNLKTAQK